MHEVGMLKAVGAFGRKLQRTEFVGLGEAELRNRLAQRRRTQRDQLGAQVFFLGRVFFGEVFAQQVRLGRLFFLGDKG